MEILHRYLNLILHKYDLDKSFGFKEIKPVFLPSRVIQAMWLEILTSQSLRQSEFGSAELDSSLL